MSSGSMNRVSGGNMKNAELGFCNNVNHANSAAEDGLPGHPKYTNCFNWQPYARPDDCECDNTHEQNDTCCMPCWEAGFRTVAPVTK